jgi:hypothetical protein
MFWRMPYVVGDAFARHDLNRGDVLDAVGQRAHRRALSERHL